MTEQQNVDNVEFYPVDKIFANPDFNCRGSINPDTVFELGRDIEKRGLISPIVIRRRTESTPAKYDYEIIAGHRRHMAHRVMQIPMIKAVLKDVKNEFEARSLNLVENIQRNQLNFKEEAYAIKHYFDAGWARDKVSKELNVSSGWVQVRFMFLSLPEEVQDAAVAFNFSQEQIRELYTLKSADKQLEACRLIKNAKQGGVKNPRLKKKLDGKRLKHRNKAELNQMNYLIQDLYKPCFATETLAWAAGNITDHDLMVALKKICEAEGREFTMPDFDGNQ